MPDRSLRPQPPDAPPSRWRRHRTALAVTAVVAAMAGAWLLWPGHHQRQEDTVTALPAPGVLVPAPDAGVPPPVASPTPTAPAAGAPAPPVAGAPDDTGTADEADATPAGAYEPRLLSDNRNLSYARRAGLHRAANPLHVTASAVAVVDGQTGELLYGRNELAILPIASLTKLLTGIVLLDAKVPLSEKIRITREDVDTLRHSRSRLRVGTELTRREALRLALMSSENRAAHALARTFPGGTDAFVARMNRKAAELGLAHSTFHDPTGLSNATRATARDVATLALAASRYPLLREFSTTRRHQAVFGKRRLQYLNSNRLVRRTDWAIALQKTGYIVEAGHCVTMVTRVKGREAVLVLLDAGSVKTRGQDTRRVRAWLARHGQPGHTTGAVSASGSRQALPGPGATRG